MFNAQKYHIVDPLPQYSGAYTICGRSVDARYLEWKAPTFADVCGNCLKTQERRRANRKYRP